MNYQLKVFSDEQLQAEIERRAKIKRIMPVELEKPNFYFLTNVVRNHVTSVVNSDFTFKIKDMKHLIYEAAMQALYGKEVWDIFKNE